MQVLKKLANAALTTAPQPFTTTNMKDVTFGWCQPAGGPDDTLKDLVAKLNVDSDHARNLAVTYLLTGDTRYAEKAAQYVLAWARHSTLVNFYQLDINFKSTHFDGMESGFCNKSWNMALDSMWQAYGLINFSDVYLVLTRNAFKLPVPKNKEMQSWLRHQLLPAMNAGCHAWTRWADAHPDSQAYERYRSDNHLSWCVAGWTAAAAALDDDELWNYALRGGAYDDGYSGRYANPSSLEAQLGYAIGADGVVYDQAVRSNEHKGFFYGNFSLWALSLAARIAEVHKGLDYWTFVGNRGGSLVKGFDHYAPYVAGDLALPDPKEKTDPAFFRFLYEMLVGNEAITGERLALYTRARNSGPRNQMIQQAVGPVTLVTGAK